MSDAFQQWWQWQLVISAGTDFYEHGMQALQLWWKCLANGGDCWTIVFCGWEFYLSNSVIVLFVPVVVSMEINNRHYFQSDQEKCDISIQGRASWQRRVISRVAQTVCLVTMCFEDHLTAEAISTHVYLFEGMQGLCLSVCEGVEKSYSTSAQAYIT